MAILFLKVLNDFEMYAFSLDFQFYCLSYCLRHVMYMTF